MCLDSTVFLVDDDAAVRDALSISMSLDDLKNEAYSSGQAFLDAYTRDRPGCLLMNLRQSEEIDGLTVQQELSRRNFSIPIIFMTGIGTTRDFVPVMHPGVFCLLEKPFPRPLLLDSIRKAIEQDCGNRRSDIKNQDETDDYSDNPHYFYKQLSPREREIMPLIVPRKSGNPEGITLEIARRITAVFRVHSTEIGAQFTLCAGLLCPVVQL